MEAEWKSFESEILRDITDSQFAFQVTLERIEVRTVLYTVCTSCSESNSLRSTFCTFLYCTVLYCTVLYCTVLYCTAQHVLLFPVMYCTALHCTAHFLHKYVYVLLIPSLQHVSSLLYGIKSFIRIILGQ